MIERQYARIRKVSRYGRQWVGRYWDPTLEVDYMLFQFRNRTVLREVFHD